MPSMIILIYVIGYVVIAALYIMAVITFAFGVALALGVYALVYAGLWVWATVTQHTPPTWRFNRTGFPVDRSEIQGYALVSGLVSLAFMGVGFIAYACTGGDLDDAFQITCAFAAIFGLVAWADKVKTKDRDNIDA